MPGDKPNFIVTTPGKTIVTFKPDGRVELGEGISPSEAAKEMFAILEPMLRQGARPVSAGEADASPAPAAIALTTDDEKLLERALMASTEKVYDIESAAMPSEEEIARIICRRVHEALYPNAGDWRPGELEQKVSIYWPHYANEARAVLALFAPILAEKERLRQTADAYDACVSVARSRVSRISPDLEEALPGLCQISRETWIIHKERAPIMAVDMLEHAKLKAAEARALAAESAVAAERERCAKVVEFYRAEVWGASAPRTALAAAIRAKGE